MVAKIFNKHKKISPKKAFGNYELVAKIFNKHKKISPKKAFGNYEFCSSRQNHSRPNSLENCGFVGKNKSQSFQKYFFGGYLFIFVECLCNRSSKIKTKNIKNYSSILAIVNHLNWLDDWPPLRLETALSRSVDLLNPFGTKDQIWLFSINFLDFLFYN